MRVASRRSLLALTLIASGALPAASIGSCGGSGVSPTTAGAGAGGTTTTTTGIVIVGSGGGISSADCGGPPADDAGDAGDDGPTGCEGLDGGVAFDAVAPLFFSCASETCHGSPWTPPELVNVVAYECCDGRPLVAPGNAARSYLVDKLAGTDLCQGGRMPLNGPPYLSAADQLLIRRWICEGAPAE